MTGRPRKVVAISTGKIGKEKRLNREIQEKAIKLERDQLEISAPAWLSTEAADEYCRVVSEAGKINLLDNLDLGVLAIYADNYARYIEASDHLQNDGLTVMGANNLIPSPYVAIADKCANTIFKCSAKLGLATTDRLRLIVPTRAEEREENKYLKYLKA